MKRLTLVLSLVCLGSPAHSFDPKDGRAERVAAETALGLVAGLGNLLVVVPLTFAVSEGSCEQLNIVAGTGLVTAFAGFGLGVYGAGAGSDANGSLGYTLLGTLIGTAFAIPIELGLYKHREHELMIAVAIVLPLVGSILGYELSTSKTFSTPPEAMQRTLMLPFALTF